MAPASPITRTTTLLPQSVVVSPSDPFRGGLSREPTWIPEARERRCELRPRRTVRSWSLEEANEVLLQVWRTRSRRCRILLSFWKVIDLPALSWRKLQANPGTIQRVSRSRAVGIKAPRPPGCVPGKQTGGALSLGVPPNIPPSAKPPLQIPASLHLCLTPRLSQERQPEDHGLSEYDHPGATATSKGIL